MNKKRRLAIYKKGALRLATDSYFSNGFCLLLNSAAGYNFISDLYGMHNWPELQQYEPKKRSKRAGLGYWFPDSDPIRLAILLTVINEMENGQD